MYLYHNRVKENFRLIDEMLLKQDTDSVFYHELFAIRTIYSVVAEKQRSIIGVFGLLKRLFRLILNGLLHVFTTTELGINTKNAILGDWHFDEYLAQKIDIPQIKPYRKLSFKGCGVRFIDCCFVLRISSYLFLNLELRKVLITLPFLLDYYRGYRSSLGNCKVIITENDIYPFNYGILLHASHKNVVRVKIEYAIIDAILHQNCFCDYYFYPTEVHRKIRENSPYNINLNYVKGGYLNKFEMELVKYKTPESLVITYFTEHGNFFVKNDIYYIDTILMLMPLDATLNIKVHPYDKVDRYSKYKNEKQVRIIVSGEIENSVLIAQSTICLSIFSTMSLDAKYICPLSFFINFEIENSPYLFDYKCFSDFFDIIDSPEFLKKILFDKYTPISLELFKENVNMTYPDTFENLKKLVNSL